MHLSPRQLDRPDAILRGDEAGTGPTLLLLHAGGERRQVWTAAIEILAAAGFRCVAFDQRGHGESDGEAKALSPCADDVAEMLRAEPPGTVVVGASLGGLAGVAALADPEVRARVGGLVLVDVVPCLDPGRVRSFLAGVRIADAHADLVEDILAHVPQLEQVTAELDLPILLVHGDHGSAVAPEQIDQLLRLAPQTTVRNVPGAGHLIARERPAALAETIAGVAASWVT